MGWLCYMGPFSTLARQWRHYSWCHQGRQLTASPLFFLKKWWPFLVIAFFSYCLVTTPTFRPRFVQCSFFTALHGMQTRSCDENSVRPSVRQTRELWQNERQIGPDVYTIWKTIYPSFLRRMVGGGWPFYPKFWVNPPPLERNRRFWTNNRS